jgi:hypothetical protein
LSIVKRMLVTPTLLGSLLLFQLVFQLVFQQSGQILLVKSFMMVRTREPLC